MHLWKYEDGFGSGKQKAFSADDTEPGGSHGFLPDMHNQQSAENQTAM